MTFEGCLAEVLAELGVSPDADQVARMCEHFELLVKWNRRVNLTSVTEPGEAARRHFGEAAFLHVELPAMASAVDVGSGGGFPGLPFAVLRPETAVTLVESKQRKSSFLRAATRGQANVEIRDCRIEEWNGRADWALVRAVAPESVLAALPARADAVAVLGTDRPQTEEFGPWRERPMPWGERRRLWTAQRRPAS